MARNLSGLITANLRAVTETPLAVGGAGDLLVDLPLAIDGSGRPFVPGTSLAGPMRRWATDSAADAKAQNLVDQVFGPRLARGSQDGHAAYLRVSHARFDAHVARELRDGIAIDRRTGTAAPRLMFQRHVIPRGACLEFSLELELPAAGEPFQAEHGRILLAAILGALGRGEILFGSAKTRGFGAIKLLDEESTRISEYPLASGEGKPQGLFDWLRGSEKPWEPPGEDKVSELFPGRRRLEAKITWKPVSAVMVKAGFDGVSVDALPLVGAFDNGEQLAAVLPGSSIKGALRSHAERIVRTALDRECGSDFGDQIDLPVVSDLFGLGKPRRDSEQGKKSHAGWLSVRDVYQITNPIDARRYAAEDFAPTDGAPGQPWGEHRDHVAIDRFTGGVADGALFSVQQPPETGWEPIHLTVSDFGRRNGGGDTDEKWHAAVALLLLVLRDLALGWVPLGFGVNRGLGAIQVDSINVTLQPGTAGGDGQSWTWNPEGGFSGFIDPYPNVLLDALPKILQTASAPGGES